MCNLPLQQCIKNGTSHLTHNVLDTNNWASSKEWLIAAAGTAVAWFAVVLLVVISVLLTFWLSARLSSFVFVTSTSPSFVPCVFEYLVYYIYFVKYAIVVTLSLSVDLTYLLLLLLSSYYYLVMHWGILFDKTLVLFSFSIPFTAFSLCIVLFAIGWWLP